MKGTVWPRPFEKDPETGVRKPVKGSTWTYQFAVVRAEGKRRFVSKGGFRTKREAEAKMAEALAANGQGGAERAEPSKMPLATFLRSEWLPTLVGLKATTRRGYTNHVETYIVPRLGDSRLCDLSAGQLASFYDTLRVSGRCRTSRTGQGAGLSERTIHAIHVTLSGALGYAVEAGALRVSPITQLPRKARPRATSGTRPEMRTWTADEARRFLDSARSDRLGALYDLALNTGLRRGELVGLRWTDIDFDGSRLAVRSNRTTVGYEVVTSTPKGKRARVVDLDPPTVAMLRRHRAAQATERLAWGAAWADSGLVFTREDGSPLHPQTVAWHLHRLARAAGVPEIRVHDLRHTHATLGLAAEVPVKVMQERLGHASSQITMDLYQHVVPGMQADAAARIGALLRTDARDRADKVLTSGA